MIFPGHNDGDDPVDLVSTHQRLLTAAVLRTTGPILELGCGAYSTTVLHEIARATRRHVVTADNNADWLDQYRALACEWHAVELVGWWGEAYDRFARRKWGVCFADHGQPIEREYAVRALIDSVDVFVLHDTEEPFAYGYGRTLKMFKYRWEDTWQKAKTTVASNTTDVTKWGLRQLPPVEPTRDVT